MEPVQTGPFSPPQAPFAPPVAPAGRGRGCTKPMIIGCLVLVLGGGILALGGVYYLVTHLGSILRHSFNKMETELATMMPPEVTQAERQRLHEAFRAASAAMAHPDKIDPVRLQRLQTELFNVSRKGKGLTREDVQNLTEALEGVTPAPSVPIPAPATPSPAPSPTGSGGRAGTAST